MKMRGSFIIEYDIEADEEAALTRRLERLAAEIVAENPNVFVRSRVYKPRSPKNSASVHTPAPRTAKTGRLHLYE